MKKTQCIGIWYRGTLNIILYVTATSILNVLQKLKDVLFRLKTSHVVPFLPLALKFDLQTLTRGLQRTTPHPRKGSRGGIGVEGCKAPRLRWVVVFIWSWSSTDLIPRHTPTLHMIVRQSPGYWDELAKVDDLCRRYVAMYTYVLYLHLTPSQCCALSIHLPS